MHYTLPLVTLATVAAAQGPGSFGPRERSLESRHEKIAKRVSVPLLMSHAQN
jgi:hypothetical protein